MREVAEVRGLWLVSNVPSKVMIDLIVQAGARTAIGTLIDPVGKRIHPTWRLTQSV